MNVGFMASNIHCDTFMKWSIKNVDLFDLEYYYKFTLWVKEFN